MSTLYDRIKDGPVWIVAEIGSNHDRSYHKAVELIHEAAKAGADAVKFQSYLADELVRKGSPDYDMLKRLEMPRSWYGDLKEYARANGVTWFSTVSNETTLGWLEEVGVEAYKVGSPTITHLPLIRQAAAIGRPMILSLGYGVGDLGEEAIRTCESAENRKLALLQCVSQYPAQSGGLGDWYQLGRRMHIGSNYPIGYSDHTLGIGTAIGAVALGARIVEKHFTLDRNAAGPDHAVSAEPGEFMAMVRAIRECEVSLTLAPEPSYGPDAPLRTLHARTSLPPGLELERKHIAVIRPNDGLEPRLLAATVGRRLKVPLAEGEPITSEVLE